MDMILRILPCGVWNWGLLTVAMVTWAHLVSGKTDLLFHSAQEDAKVTVHLEMNNPRGGPPQTMDLQVEDVMLKKLGLTKEEIESGDIEPDPEGHMRYLKVKGHSFDLQKEVKQRTAMHFINAKGFKDYTIDLQGFLRLTLKDLENDPTLVPADPVSLEWPKPKIKLLRTLEVFVSSTNATVIGNNVMICHQIAREINPGYPWYHAAGLLVVVLNPWTSDLTLHEVFPTSEYGAHRDLRWTLESILPGRLVVLASVHDGSLNLGPVRLYLEDLGSEWAEHYLFRDLWAWVFVKGGPTLADGLVPNLRSMKYPVPPLKIRVDLPWPSHEKEDWTHCREWKLSTEWQKRAMFCATHDGFNSLCSCRNPFIIPKDPPKETPLHWRENIPILIITGGRIRYLYRLIESLGLQPGVRQDLILIAVDGPQEDIIRLADVLGLNILIHRPEGEGPARVSRNLRFGLFHLLKKFPKAEKFIVLEDDLIVSPDFYSYMQQTGWILDHDPSVYCSSGFNHLSYGHTARDPTRLYRVHSNPSCGWMTTRAVLEDLLPKWLPSNVTHDWDHFMASKIIRKGRECIVPDVNRSYHGGTTGTHLGASYTTEKDYLNRTYNMQHNVTLMDPKRLLLAEYEREMHELLQKAENLDLDDFHKGRIQTKPGGVYVIFAHKEGIEDDTAFRAVGDILGIWNRDARDTHYHTWRLTYNEATLLVVGVPASKYSSYRDPNIEVYDVDEDFLDDLQMEDLRSRLKLKIKTHSLSSHLPVGHSIVSLASRRVSEMLSVENESWRRISDAISIPISRWESRVGVE